MTHRTDRVARLLAGSLIALSALSVAACGSSSASTAASASAAAPASSAPAAATATPAPTVAPSAVASAAASPQASAAESASAALSVKVDLASGWQEVQMTADALAAQIKLIQATSPQQAASLQQILDSGAFKNFLFYALQFDGTKNTGNLNVTTVNAGGMSIDAAQPLIEGEFKQLGATDIAFQKATIGGVESLQIDYKISLKTQAGSAIAMTGRGYFIPHGSVLVNVTTTCYGATATQCLADGDTMANGMTISG